MDEEIVDNGSENRDEPKEFEKPVYVPGKPFSKDNQPDPEKKSAGWWKKQKGRQLLRSLMQHDYQGTELDEHQNPIPDTIKNQVAAYMNVPIETVTVEMCIFVMQIGKAIKLKDTQAANLVVDNAYGKPKETFQVYDDEKPQLVFAPKEIYGAPPVETNFEEEVDGEQIISPENNNETT